MPWDHVSTQGKGSDLLVGSAMAVGRQSGDRWAGDGPFLVDVHGHRKTEKQERSQTVWFTSMRNNPLLLGRPPGFALSPLHPQCCWFSSLLFRYPAVPCRQLRAGLAKVSALPAPVLQGHCPPGASSEAATVPGPGPTASPPAPYL